MIVQIVITARFNQHLSAIVSLLSKISCRGCIWIEFKRKETRMFLTDSADSLFSYNCKKQLALKTVFIKCFFSLKFVRNRAFFKLYYISDSLYRSNNIFEWKLLLDTIFVFVKSIVYFLFVKDLFQVSMYFNNFLFFRNF